MENINDPAADGPPVIAYEMASRTGRQWPLVERRKVDRRQQDRRRQAPQANPLADIARLCTSREQQAVRLLLRGMTNKQIAQALGIAEDTVKKHVQNAYKKLGVRRRALLIAERARQP